MPSILELVGWSRAWIRVRAVWMVVRMLSRMARSSWSIGWRAAISSSAGVAGNHVHAAPKPRRWSRVPPTEHVEGEVDGKRRHPAGVVCVGIGDPGVAAAHQLRAVVQAVASGHLPVGEVERR